MHAPDSEQSTRDAVARAILERGPLCAAEIADSLGLSAAAVRRHLDALQRRGLLEQCAPRRLGAVAPGRGRPARAYQLTEAGRAAFPHAYDDLASTALAYLRHTGGEQAIVGFAQQRAEQLAQALADQIAPAGARAHELGANELGRALARALSAQGYAADAKDTTAGVQICQHHCPVAHVASQYPELCEAETRAFEKLLGTNVQRLATIAHGDGICTTHVFDRSRMPLTEPAARSAPIAHHHRTSTIGRTHDDHRR